MFSALTMPRLEGRSITWSLGTLIWNLRSVSADESLEPSLTTMTSSDFGDWVNTLERTCRSHLQELKHGITTEIVSAIYPEIHSLQDEKNS